MRRLEMKGIFRWSEESRNSKLMGTFGGDGDSLSYPRPSPRRAGGTLNFTCKRKKKKRKGFTVLMAWLVEMITGSRNNSIKFFAWRYYEGETRILLQFFAGEEFREIFKLGQLIPKSWRNPLGRDISSITWTKFSSAENRWN